MTVGELEYDSLFRQDPGGLKPGDGLQEEIEFEALARVLWLIFLIFMPIILINLLVRIEGTCTLYVYHDHIYKLSIDQLCTAFTDNFRGK